MSMISGKYDSHIISIKMNFCKIQNFESAGRVFLPKVKKILISLNYAFFSMKIGMYALYELLSSIIFGKIT